MNATRSPSPTNTTATVRRQRMRRRTIPTTGSSASASTMPVAMRSNASAPLLTRPTTSKHREERAADGEQRDPVELERHSRSHPLDGLGQRWGDRCLWDLWFFCLVGFAGLGSHPRYCTRQ